MKEDRLYRTGYGAYKVMGCIAGVGDGWVVFYKRPVLGHCI